MQINCQILRIIRHETTRSPLSSSAALFHNCNWHGVSRSTRCSVLRDMVEGWEAEPRPPLDKTHRLKRPEWAKESLDRFFSGVLWTDEMKITQWLWSKRPDGRAHGWISDGRRAPLWFRHQQGEGGVLVWKGSVKDELVGLFQVENGM